MSDTLLPANATAQEFALEQTVARASNVPVPVRDVWNVDRCPDDLLPWLAWAYSVDEWDVNWTADQRRGAIRTSMESHRHKGTIGAVREALGGLGYSASVQEWFNQIPAGDPYTYKLILESRQIGIDQEALAKILAVVDSKKSLRSHMSVAEPIVITTAGPKMAMVCGIGTEITVQPSDFTLLSDGVDISNGSQRSNGIRAEWTLLSDGSTTSDSTQISNGYKP